jgi:hypothetical protein
MVETFALPNPEDSKLPKPLKDGDQSKRLNFDQATDVPTENISLLSLAGPPASRSALDEAVLPRKDDVAASQRDAFIAKIPNEWEVKPVIGFSQTDPSDKRLFRIPLDDQKKSDFGLRLSAIDRVAEGRALPWQEVNGGLLKKMQASVEFRVKF